MVKVYETWTVAGCMRRIRGQAKDVTRVHSIYVVDKEDKLVGRLSLKDLIIAKSDQKIAEISKSKVDSVNVSEKDEEVVEVQEASNDDDVASIDEATLQAAAADAFPPELDPAVVWLETVNEVDKNRC